MMANFGPGEMIGLGDPAATAVLVPLGAFLMAVLIVAPGRTELSARTALKNNRSSTNGHGTSNTTASTQSHRADCADRGWCDAPVARVRAPLGVFQNLAGLAHLNRHREAA